MPGVGTSGVLFCAHQNNTINNKHNNDNTEHNSQAYVLLVELGLEVEEAQVHVAAAQQVGGARELVAEEHLLLEAQLHHRGRHQAGQADEALAAVLGPRPLAARRAAHRARARALAFALAASSPVSALQTALAQVELALVAVPALALTCARATVISNNKHTRSELCVPHESQLNPGVERP